MGEMLVPLRNNALFIAQYHGHDRQPTHIIPAVPREGGHCLVLDHPLIVGGEILVPRRLEAAVLFTNNLVESDILRRPLRRNAVTSAGAVVMVELEVFRICRLRAAVVVGAEA